MEATQGVRGLGCSATGGDGRAKAEGVLMSMAMVKE